MLSKKLAAIAAVSLITASSAAVAQSAQPLSLTNSPAVQRAGSDLQGESNLDRRGVGIYIIGAVVIALLVWGAIKLLDKSDSP